MIRARNTLAVSMLLLTAALARGQERGPSHTKIVDWERSGSSPMRAAEMARQLREAGIGPPSSQSVEPETIKKLLDLLDRIDKSDSSALKNALKNRDVAEKLQDPDFARQL